VDLTPQRTKGLAEALLTGVGTRLRHVAGVAKQVRDVAVVVPPQQEQVLVAAAWLHDVGYAPGLAVSGFHPLDGARYLRREGYPPAVCSLVAFHSGSRFEAEERGLVRELTEFAEPPGLLLDALVWADMTTSSTGNRCRFDERMEDILSRYPADDPVHRAVTCSWGELHAAVSRTEQRLLVADASHPM